MNDFFSTVAQAKTKMPFHLPGTLSLAQWIPIPHRFRTQSHPRSRPRRGRKKSAASLARPEAVTALQTSFNPTDGFKALREHQWSLWDFQHLITATLVIFSFWISPIPRIIIAAVFPFYTLLVLMPATRQFFLPSLPIWTYLLYFFTSKFIPFEYRPHIWVKVLPALENILYGANISNILSAHTYAVLDLLAWLPYGICHFGGPAATAAALFLFAAPGSTPVFAKAFGFMNMIGVTTQLVFPTTPPWYEKAHGLEPARYGMEGSPAGLAKIDQLFGVDMYTTSFTTAPVPFGAFPSLHSADATLEALFLCYCFPRFKPFFIAYVGWIWWATMYLNHHYAIDLVGGSLLACTFYYIAKTQFLPRRQLDKKTRWQYEHVSIGEKTKIMDEEYGYLYSGPADVGLGLLSRRGTSDSDEWTLHSSSSYISGESSTRNPSTPGSMSPHGVDDGFDHTAVAGLTSQGHFWDGEPQLRDSELSEVVVVR